MGRAIAFEGLHGYLADGGGPGIVVLHEWWGLVPQVMGVCDRLAALGFTALAPDLYQGQTAVEVVDAETLLANLDRDRAIAQIALPVADLRRRGCATVGGLGFCTGAALVLAASARCDLDATVAYYGIWPHEGERDIKTPILVHVAEHEEHNPPCLPENFPRFFEGMSNAEVHVYPGTQHAFFDETRPERYDSTAAELSWDRTVGFLRAHLR